MALGCNSDRYPIVMGRNAAPACTVATLAAAPRDESQGYCGMLTVAHAWPTSPPVLFWSPSCTMNCIRYV